MGNKIGKQLVAFVVISQTIKYTDINDNTATRSNIIAISKKQSNNISSNNIDINSTDSTSTDVNTEGKADTHHGRAIDRDTDSNRIEIDSTSELLASPSSSLSTLTNENTRGIIEMHTTASRPMLVIDDVINEKEDKGDTDSVDSSDEIIDLTQSTYDTFGEKMYVLVKDDNNGEEATSYKNDN